MSRRKSIHYSLSRRIKNVKLSISGHKFMKKYINNTKFIKLTNKQGEYNNVKYTRGLNESDVSVQCTGEYSDGGICFTKLKHIGHLVNNHHDDMYYSWYAYIPDSANVYILNNYTYVTDKIVLNNKIPIYKLRYWNNLHNSFRSIKQDTKSLLYIKNQTPYLCLVAVRHDGCAIQYIKKPSYLIKIEAVKQNGLALKFIKYQNDIICLEAVKQNGKALMYVIKQNPDICLNAVKQNEFAFVDIDKQYQSNKICKIAVSKCWHLLEYVKNQTLEICKIAINNNYHAIKCVNNKTLNICMYAINKNIRAVAYIKPAMRTKIMKLKKKRKRREYIRAKTR